VIDLVHAAQGSVEGAIVVQAGDRHFYRDAAGQAWGIWRGAQKYPNLHPRP
jgi:hypothetical protein